MPYNCFSYGCSELDDHEYVLCGEELLGGVPSVLALECDHSITDPSSAAQLNAAIANGTAKLIKNVMVGMPAASPIEVQRMVSNEPTYAVNYDRSATIKDANITPQNITFFDSFFSGQTFGGLILFNNGDPDNKKVFWIDAAVSAQGSVVIPENNNEQIRAEGTIKWKSKANPMMYDAPVGVFD